MITRIGLLLVLFPAVCMADAVVPIDAVEETVEEADADEITSKPKQRLEVNGSIQIHEQNSSSRDRKENIAELRLDAATETLMALQPVVFNYRNEPQEDYLGFIAEDVPDLVAVGDRAALSPMDIVAVLTRVVQQQEKKIQALEARLDAL